HCNPIGLSFSFTGCQLQHASFYKVKSRKTRFNKCQLVEVDFAEADLTEGIFADCDLSGAIFDQTILERRISEQLIISPLIRKTTGSKRPDFRLAAFPGCWTNTITKSKAKPVQNRTLAPK